MQAQNAKAIRLYQEALNVLEEGEELLAVDKLELALEIDSTFIKARYNLGLLYREMGKLDLANTHFTVLIRQQAAFPKAYVLRGRIRLESNKLDEALADFKMASLMYPGDYDAWHGMGSVHFMYENYEGAEEFFNRALNIFPEFPACYNDRGSARMMLGKWDLAMEDYKLAVNFMPNNARYINNLAMLYLMKGEIQQAKNQIERAMAINEEPEISSNLLFLCHIAEEKNMSDSARVLSPYFELNAANAYVFENKYDMALQLNQRVEQMNSDSDLAGFQCLQKVRILIAMHRYEDACEAISTCNTALEYKNLVCP